MIHAYQSNGIHIVLDVNSGAVHLPDALTYTLIPEVEQRLIRRFGTAAQTENDGDQPDALSLQLVQELLSQPGEEIAAALAVAIADAGDTDIDQLLGEALLEILTLREQGQLYTEDPYEKYATAFKNRQTVVKALCLNVAHDCNLACRYCFAGQGEYQGQRALMPAEVGRAALDFLVKNSGSRRNLEVDFFGGEPLLNWEMVKETVRYGRSLEEANNKHFRFTLTTNGTLLNDEILEFANREMDNIVLSIDGRREINDRMRPWRGAGTAEAGKTESVYDRIVPKYLEVARSRGGERYFVRGTFTRENLDFSEDVKHLADLGFTQISVEPVVADPSEPYALREEDIPKLLEEYDKLAEIYLDCHRKGRPFSFFHFNIDLEGGPCVAKRLSGCGSGCEYLGVTPSGDLYPCHQFVGNEAFVMGNVFTGITRQDIREKFLASNVYTREECRSCFARYYCSGGCAANAWNFGGDINANYPIGCALQKKRIECAIMLKAALSGDQISEKEGLQE
ncbi:MAG: thioether cross-link-forming SCIFF peptide maturase [Lachnospiraceae bacterium]|nr:thioether cross-link-forming SCIFF peptide maturase [Lachnospiraceae bacterium]